MPKLTPAQFAKAVGLSRASVMRAIEGGRIKARAVKSDDGRVLAWEIAESEVRRFKPAPRGRPNKATK